MLGKQIDKRELYSNFEKNLKVLIYVCSPSLPVNKNLRNNDNRATKKSLLIVSFAHFMEWERLDICMCM